MVTPVGASLFTRKEEQNYDYDWKYVKNGTFQLLDIAKAIYATVLCRDHTSNIDAVKFAVFQQGQRLGLLVADMPTLRRDFANKSISTTLYLEFALSEKTVVLNAVATLLNLSGQENQIFLDYAENLFKNPLSPLKSIQLPKIMVSASPPAVVKKKGLVFFPTAHRSRYKEYVSQLPDNFCFVSTGYVGSSQYRELESVFNGGLLVLTLSDEVKIINKPYPTWQMPTNWTTKKLLSGLGVAVFVCVAIFVVIQKKSESAQEQAKIEQVKQLQATLSKEKEKNSSLQRKIEQIEAEINKLKEQVKQLDSEKTESNKKVKELEGQLAQFSYSPVVIPSDTVIPIPERANDTNTGSIIPSDNQGFGGNTQVNKEISASDGKTTDTTVEEQKKTPNAPLLTKEEQKSQLVKEEQKSQTVEKPIEPIYCYWKPEKGSWVTYQDQPCLNPVYSKDHRDKYCYWKPEYGKNCWVNYQNPAHPQGEECHPQGKGCK